jgi:mannitol/fructose-specific phosphotransferase system IIA component (Ntr-type)
MKTSQNKRLSIFEQGLKQKQEAKVLGDLSHIRDIAQKREKKGSTISLKSKKAPICD